MTKHQQVALVTGGATGIGLAISTALAGKGIKVLVAGRTATLIATTAASLDEAVPLQMDVTDETSVLKAFSDLDDQGLMPDILINNAGAAGTAKFERTSLTLWQQMLDVNLTGAFLCAKAAVPNMKENHFGRVVTIASTAGLKGYAYTAAYSAAKHGVIGMTRSLALELAGTGVTANAICPGFTDTDIVRDSVKAIVATTGRSSGDALKELTRHNPEGRLITPQEVASAVLYLVSDEASAMNGQSIAVAGGEVM